MGDFIRYDVREVDLNKPLLRTNTGVLLAAGDKSANRFGAILHRDGEPVDMAGQAVTVTGYFVRPDGYTVVCEGVQDGNMVYVDLPASCYAQSGAFSLAIKVRSADISQTVRVIDGVIRLTHTDKIVDPGEVVPSLDDLLGCVAQVQKLADSTATPIVAEASGDVATITDAGERNAVAVMSAVTAELNGTPDPVAGTVQSITPHNSVRLYHGAAYDEAAEAIAQAALPSAIYGGTLDWMTGVLTVTHDLLDATSSAWKASQTAKRYNFTVQSASLDACTHYPLGGMNKDNSFWRSGSQAAFNTEFDTLEAWTAYLAEQSAAGTPLCILRCLPEAQRYTVQLDPHTLTMLKGNNAIWSDTGSTSVCYIADTKLYIDSKFTALQNAILAQGVNV
jgi:hypothetical protein